jgi:hypothetical protein
MATQPPIVTRSQWGAASRVSSGRNVALSSRRFFVVHWPVMSSRDERQWVRDIERMHMNQGWSAASPGYNFLVGMSGTIFEGCGRDVRGIHSPPHNTDGWGVCVLQPSTAQGNPTSPITDAAKTSTVNLYNWLCSVTGRQLNKWYHGKDYATACPGPDLRNWVNAGMPAKGGVTPGPSPQPTPQLSEDDNSMTSELSANGTLHCWMVGPQRQSVWVTWQSPDSPNWQGGQSGRGPAGWTKFWDAPTGRTIRGITAKLSKSGNLHFWATLDNGTSFYTWQRPNDHEWRGGSASSRLGTFAPWPI